MSFDSLLVNRATIHARTKETELWPAVGGTVACRITALSAGGARRESRIEDPDVTHVCRMRPNSLVAVGQRFRDTATGNEYEVKTLREHPVPAPGQLVIGLIRKANVVA